MKKILKLSFVVFIISFVFGCVAMTKRIVFKALDTNKDGFLTKDEFVTDQENKEEALEEFKLADKNQDNIVTKDEMKVYIKSNM